MISFFLMRHLWIFFSILSLSSWTSPAQAEKEGPYRDGYVPGALPFYTPDLGFGVGGALVYYRYPKATTKYPHEHVVQGAWSMRELKTLMYDGTHYFNDDQFLFRGDFGLTLLKTRFFGVNNHYDQPVEEDYSSFKWFATGSFLKKYVGDWYFGPFLDLRTTRITQTDPSGVLKRRDLVGSNGFTNIGFGSHIRMRSTDASFHPTEGQVVDTWITYNLGYNFLQEDKNFLKIITDYRKYFALSDKEGSVIATHFQGEFNFGSPPFRRQAMLGGNEMMRGLFEYRYLDQNALRGQIEYRSPYFWRMGGTLFYGVGTVFATPAKLFEEQLHSSGGVGLRFLLDKKEKVPLRVDMGLDEFMNLSFYVIIRQAF